MKLKKVLCMAVLSAAVALSGVPVSGAAVIAHAEETQISNLDEILRAMYALYTAGDYVSMQALDIDSTTEACVEAVQNSGSDRYVIDLDGNIKAMLYVTQDGDNWWWYFGQMENNLRQGNGTTIILYSDATEIFTGTYAADMPNGNGKLSVQYIDDIGSSYEISGNFQGAYLNGVYQVNANWIGDDGLPYASSLSTVYANNHFQSVNGWNLELHPYADEGYTEYYFWNDNAEIYFDIKNGYELFVAGLLTEGSQPGHYWAEKDLDSGLDIFSGSTDASAYALTLPAVPAVSPETPDTVAPTPETPAVTTPAPTVSSSTYTVERGDNLSKIAQKVYGDKKLWRKIYDANSNVIKDDYIIWANQTLVIPQ